MKLSTTLPRYPAAFSLSSDVITRVRELTLRAQQDTELLRQLGFTAYEDPVCNLDDNYLREEDYVEINELLGLRHRPVNAANLYHYLQTDGTKPVTRHFHKIQRRNVRRWNQHLQKARRLAGTSVNLSRVVEALLNLAMEQLGNGVQVGRSKQSSVSSKSNAAKVARKPTDADARKVDATGANNRRTSRAA